MRVTTGKEDVTQNFNIKTDEVSSRHKVVRKDVVVKVVVIIDVLQAVLGYYFFLVHQKRKVDEVYEKHKRKSGHLKYL